MKLSKPDQIWQYKPKPEDLVAGARYAALSLPWTFNRMMLNTSSTGQQFRALNIAKGIVGQEVLRRALAERGVEAKVQRKSYRDDDLFDFKIRLNGKEANVDIKTMNYYTDYKDLGRENFSPELVVKYADYCGPDWRKFFPMLVPHTQIGQDKDAYCFAIASSIDFRNDKSSNRSDYAFTAFPHGPLLVFLSSQKLCRAREEAGKGIYCDCTVELSASLFRRQVISLTVLGEFDGRTKKVTAAIRPGVKKKIGPFSCVASFQISKEDYENLADGSIKIEVSDNELSEPVFNARRKNINETPDIPLVLTQGHFCNLILPNDYELYFLGWIPKSEFIRVCRRYDSWIWPEDSTDRFSNRPWTQITQKDWSSIKRAKFDDCVSEKPRRFRAGWMKTHGHGGGACCYVYPNIGANGGVKETNLYVLPQDLYPMDDLGSRS